MRENVTLACTECKQRNYETEKNKRNNPDRIEKSKFCKFCGKHTTNKAWNSEANEFDLLNESKENAKKWLKDFLKV